MASLGFSDGVEAGQESVLQGAFDRGYRDGLAGAERDAVRMTSVLATFAEFYARHGAALGVPVSIAALVFDGASRLARDDIMHRLARLLSNGTTGGHEAAQWAQLFGWGDARAGEVEFMQAQFDVAVDATIRSAGPSLSWQQAADGGDHHHGHGHAHVHAGCQ
ncbi:hypothetical protein T492DRAFT_1108196 [Pavlovales sp. CCMP2436]|nr:hypothetical protein T492DRAFT_1108196 [Pavlovales sp. CCMP2436]